MKKELTQVGKARRIAGMTQVEAAKIIGISSITYSKKEQQPEKFTLAEFFRLYKEMDGESQQVMWSELTAQSQ